MSKSVVYAIAAPEICIKFGVANDPQKRLKKLQTDSPVDLKVLAFSTPLARADAFRLEWTIHRAVLSYHVRGEWFRSCPKTLGIVELLKAHRAEKVFEIVSGWATDEWIGALRNAGGVRVDGAFRRSGKHGYLMLP